MAESQDSYSPSGISLYLCGLPITTVHGIWISYESAQDSQGAWVCVKETHAETERAGDSQVEAVWRFLSRLESYCLFLCTVFME